MSLSEYFHELLLPLRSLPVMLFVLLVLLLAGFVMAVSIVNLWMAAGLTAIFGLMLLPGLTRYLMSIAEWRAEGRRPEPPDVEMFTITGSYWQLSALLIPIACLAACYRIDVGFGYAGSVACLLIFAVVYPAVAGVLVITHSVVQSFRPGAVLGLIAETRGSYWFAPLTVFATVGLPVYIARSSLSLAVVVFTYWLFAFFAVTGAVLRKPRLIGKIGLPDPVGRDSGQQLADLQRQRAFVLTHAYGFASRGNRQGAFEHLDDWLRRDPDPDDASRWFLEQMLRWEQPDHGLGFAQRHLAALLVRGEKLQAVKLMLRCRLIDERFRPLPDDMPLAICAAEACGNAALADALKRS